MILSQALHTTMFETFVCLYELLGIFGSGVCEMGVPDKYWAGDALSSVTGCGTKEITTGQ